MQLGAFQQGDGPLGGVHARVVVVVAQHQLLGVLFQNADVLFRQSRAHGGDGVVKARLMQGDDVDVALHQNHVGPFGVFGVVEAI